MSENTLINATTLVLARLSRRLTVRSVFVVALLAPLSSQGQHYRMRDGRTLAANAVVVRGNQLVRALEVKDGGVAEVGYPLSGVAALDWPEPEELRRAQENFVKGATAEALPWRNASVIASWPTKPVTASASSTGQWWL